MSWMPARIAVVQRQEKLSLFDMGAVALCHQSRLRGARCVAIGNQHLELGAGVAVVEHEQELALLDMHAVADQQLADHAAIRMLHALAPPLDLEIAGGDRRARDRGERAP